MYNLGFIKQKDLEKHIKDTLNDYKKVLKGIDLKKFNSNIIDPIKLIFDKNVYKKSFEEIINFEIDRQRDKSNSNYIGYFHQNIFKYIRDCKVPKEGWDVIFKDKYYVEIKNKHNTMNSSSAQKTYIKMQNKISKNPEIICMLVEVISTKSQDLEWKLTVDKKKCTNPNIRKISMDKFYELVTGESDAFYKLCKQIPIIIEKIINEDPEFALGKDTVIEELKTLDNDVQKSLYLLAFKDYKKFKN